MHVFLSQLEFKQANLPETHNIINKLNRLKSRLGYFKTYAKAIENDWRQFGQTH
jgi:hypothetical protein